jgi:hypothetical protein
MVIKDKVKVYCVDYYPHTTYEKIKINKGDQTNE